MSSVGGRRCIIEFRIGAFGSEEADRKQLAPLAIMRAEEVLDRMLMHEEVVVVCSTPAEVSCACTPVSLPRQRSVRCPKAGRG